MLVVALRGCVMIWTTKVTLDVLSIHVFDKRSRKSLTNGIDGGRTP